MLSHLQEEGVFSLCPQVVYLPLPELTCMHITISHIASLVGCSLLASNLLNYVLLPHKDHSLAAVLLGVYASDILSTKDP